MISNVEQKRVYNGFFKMDQVKFDQKKFEGGEMKDVVREVFIRKPVVFLSLYDPNHDKYLFVEQVRVGAIVCEDNNESTVLEPVAGIIDEGENPIDAAIREAKEESCVEVDPDTVTIVQEGFTSPGGSSEYAYFATAHFDSTTFTTQAGGMEDEQEDIRTHLIDGDQALDMVANGEINSMSGAFGVMWHNIYSR